MMPDATTNDFSYCGVEYRLHSCKGGVSVTLWPGGKQQELNGPFATEDAARRAVERAVGKLMREASDGKRAGPSAEQVKGWTGA